MEEEVRKMLTFQRFEFLFLQKVTLEVSKCITCGFSSFSCWSFSGTNNNKPRSKLLSLPTISCFDFFIGCSRDGFEELEWAWAKAQKNDGTHEFKVAPNYFFSTVERWHFQESLWGGLDNGRDCSKAEMPRRYRQWSRLLMGEGHGVVSVIVKVNSEPKCRGGLGDGWYCS